MRSLALLALRAQGTFVGPGNVLGEPIRIEDAEEHIFGLCILNDWSGACASCCARACYAQSSSLIPVHASRMLAKRLCSRRPPPSPAARDIQRWEYVPLGPFGAKNFCTSISPWVVTLDALEPFRCATSAGTQSEPAPLPYLRDPHYGSYDIQLEVTLRAAGMAAPVVISRSNFSHLYWNIKQQLVHHTVTGCNMRPGDLLGSGTISGAVCDACAARGEERGAILSKLGA